MANWDLFRDMESMTRDMDHLLRSFGRAGSLEPSFAATIGGRGYPRINLREDADNFYLQALLPGIDASTLDMTVLKNTLAISGERSNGADPQVTWHRRERGTGRFLRTVDLPADIEADETRADYRDGVLSVVLPKAAAAKPKRVEIRAN